MIRLRRAATLVTLAMLTGAFGGCGLEACFGLGDFEPTPPPRAHIAGVVGDLPDALTNRGAGATLAIRALSVDGTILGETTGNMGEPFELELGPDEDHFNVRVVAVGGQLVLKAVLPEASADGDYDLGTLGIETTAATLVVERYAVRERANLASTPPGTVAAVYANARGTGSEVTAFRAVVKDLVEPTDPVAGDPVLDPSSYEASDAGLSQAGISGAGYTAALEAAVDASVVPVVCDPSQIRVLFTVDASGQAKDGNGAAQFIRQPAKEGKIFLGITLDPLSPVPDSAGALKPRLTPNDPDTAMFDDGTHGDEEAGDGVYSLTLDLPRGMRVLYKYTNGSAGEGFTGTEEWPGNARILEANDVLTSSVSGAPDCLVVRRDAFGDESSNKNFVNLHARLGGGDLNYSTDLGGPSIAAPASEDLLRAGGLALGDIRASNTLTPDGVPEARENGVCSVCPPPITVSAEDDNAPRLVAAAFLSTDETRLAFSEDVDLQTAGRPGNYLLVGPDNVAVTVTSAQVSGSTVTLRHEPVDPRDEHRVHVSGVTDASLAQNPVADGTSLRVGPDQTPPLVLEVRASSIVEIDPGSLPGNPETGEVVIVSFSEVLDRISAENASNYTIDGLEVYAAFQRGRDVLLVTGQQTRGAPYALTVGYTFDVAGNLNATTDAIAFRGLSLSLVTFRAVVDYAWTSIDGADRGLPDGEGLYLTGTVMKEARGIDGEDLRANGRTDIAGIAGFEFSPSDEMYEGVPIYTLTLRLPAGTYAYKLAHGNPDDARDPPPTLETVTKNLATRNDIGGVTVDPVTLLGRDGISYASARLSVNGQDLPGPGVLFKRENPDDILVVGESDLTSLPAQVVGTWRDVPFGVGNDYDDGQVELPLVKGGVDDADAPKLLGARARDSESVLLSFDEAIDATAPFTVAISLEGDALAVQETIVGVPTPNQVVVRTATMENDQAYSLLLSAAADLEGNALSTPVTVGFTSPSFYAPFTPIVDDTPPSVIEVEATEPDEVSVLFSERLDPTSVTADAFAFSHTGGGAAPALAASNAVRLTDGGLRVLLTLAAPMERQAPYRVSITGVSDIFGNEMDPTNVDFAGFGEFDPPTIEWARAVTPNLVAVLFNEPVQSATASVVGNYSIGGLTVSNARFSGAPDIVGAAFNTNWAPVRADLVLLETSAMSAGQTYTVTASGVTDRSDNESDDSATFTGIATTPTVDVVFSYLVSDTATVEGLGAGGGSGIPPRALSLGTLSTQREGVFVVGTALTTSGADPILDHPFTLTLGGYPPDGAPLDGAELELMDDGTGGDVTAGNGVFTTVIEDVPLGSTLSYKAFASFDAAWAVDHPEVPGAAFADATPGPSVFGDGQEFPGNDNAVFLVADVDGDGKIVIENLFGDEVTFKRKTGFPAFHFAIDAARRQP